MHLFCALGNVLTVVGKRHRVVLFVHLAHPVYWSPNAPLLKHSLQKFYLGLAVHRSSAVLTGLQQAYRLGSFTYGFCYHLVALGGRVRWIFALSVKKPRQVVLPLSCSDPNVALKLHFDVYTDVYTGVIVDVSVLARLIWLQTSSTNLWKPGHAKASVIVQLVQMHKESLEWSAADITKLN